MPRIGLSFRLTPKTTLRAGYGIFHDSIGASKTTAIQTGFSQSTPIQASLDNGLTYVATNANPLPNGLLAPLGPKGGLTTNLNQSLQFYNYHRTHLQLPAAVFQCSACRRGSSWRKGPRREPRTRLGVIAN
jgi:hypothetical protein